METGWRLATRFGQVSIQINGQEALAIYDDLKTEYGDLAALERRDEWARKERREITGSHVGSSASAVRIQVPTAGGRTLRVSGAEYYSKLEGFVSEIRDFEYDISYRDFAVVEEEATP